MVQSERIELSCFALQANALTIVAYFALGDVYSLTPQKSHHSLLTGVAVFLRWFQHLY